MRAVARGPRGEHERAADVGREVVLRRSAVADLEALASSGGRHRERRARGHALVATRPVHDVRADSDRRDAFVVPEDPRRSLVRELVDAVEGRRRGAAGLRARARDRSRCRPRSSSHTRGPGSGRARAFTASKTTTVPTTLTRAPRTGSARQNGTCSAARWTTCVISCSSRASAESVAVGDVARHERHALALLLVEDQPEAAVVVTEVVADRVFAVVEQRLDRPRADAAERAGDERAAAGGQPQTGVWLKPDPRPCRTQASGASW